MESAAILTPPSTGLSGILLSVRTCSSPYRILQTRLLTLSVEDKALANFTNSILDSENRRILI